MQKGGNEMNRIGNIFSIYIDIVMLCIGLYMVFVQSSNLLEVTKFERESDVVKVLGWGYIIVSIIGFVLFVIN